MGETQIQAHIRIKNELNHRIVFLEQEVQEKRRLEEEVKSLKSTIGDWVDLKLRIASATEANAFMRGYLARVQEDDRVREELVTVGDPQGEQNLVPKRKFTNFPRHDAFETPHHDGPDTYYGASTERRRVARHWVNY